MSDRGQAGRALAALAATAGTGYASGRELVLFFAQTGRASWVGIAFASLTFGLMTGALSALAVRMAARSFPQLCRRLLGARAGGAACALYALTLALAAAAMLRRAGETGALTLPVKNGFSCGAMLGLLIAVALNLGGLRAMPRLGLWVLALGLAFYAALAVDARPCRIYLRGDVRLALEGSAPAAILLALIYGAMNAGLAAGAAVRFSGDGARPARFGLDCGAMQCALLLCANAALARGGRLLLAQAMPTVILAARWGTAGFWVCAGFGYLCFTATLTAALGGLIDLVRDGLRRAGPPLGRARQSPGGGVGRRADRRPVEEKP